VRVTIKCGIRRANDFRLLVCADDILSAGLGHKEGDSIHLHAAGVRDLEIERQPDMGELLARLRKFRGKLSNDFKFDRLEAN
jgi:hypothetical protein